MFVWRQIEALREDFPKLAQLLGDGGFYAAAEKYLRANPSTHTSLERLGRHFAPYLAESPGPAGCTRRSRGRRAGGDFRDRELVRRGMDRSSGGNMPVIERIDPVVSKLREAEWVPQLLMRLFVGYFFFETGWGKVHNLDAMTERFEGWGIPAPGFTAALSGYTELIGGALVLVGLLTRLASIPLVINMLVALLVVKMKKVSGLDDFVELDEPLYALSFFWLVFSGPGKASLDHLLWRALRRRPATGPARPAIRAG